MTKNELLTELAARDWCENVSEPTLKETKSDGMLWYYVGVRDIGGNIGVYRNIHFYVVDEGGPGEVAYYKDSEPENTLSRASAMTRWMKNAVLTAPDNYKGVQILWLSEKLEMVIFAVLEGTPLEQKVYYARKGQGPKTEIVNFDINLLHTGMIGL